MKEVETFFSLQILLFKKWQQKKKCEATSTNHLRTKGERLETAASGAAAGKKAQTQPFLSITDLLALEQAKILEF